VIQEIIEYIEFFTYNDIGNLMDQSPEYSYIFNCCLPPGYPKINYLISPWRLSEVRADGVPGE